MSAEPRADMPHPSRRTRRRQAGFVRAVFGWLVVLGLIWGAYHWSRERARSAAEAGTAPGFAVSAPACADPLPPEGLLDPATGAPVAGPTTFDNRSSYDLLLELGPAQGAQRVVVPAGARVTAQLPAGAHAWRLRRGAAWCARTQRFVREQQLEITTPLELVATSNLTVRIEPGSGASGIAISLADQPVARTEAGHLPSQATALSSDGRLVLARGRDGHFRIDGAIDDAPLRFLIDTGATEVAVPEEFARRLGATGGERVIARTANGTVEGYAFVARSLRVGPFAFENVRVTALPVLHGDALLGMRVLSAFELSQTGDALALMPR